MKGKIAFALCLALAACQTKEPSSVVTSNQPLVSTSQVLSTKVEAPQKITANGGIVPTEVSKDSVVVAAVQSTVANTNKEEVKTAVPNGLPDPTVKFVPSPTTILSQQVIPSPVNILGDVKVASQQTGSTQAVIQAVAQKPQVATQATQLQSAQEVLIQMTQPTFQAPPQPLQPKQSQLATQPTVYPQEFVEQYYQEQPIPIHSQSVEVLQPVAPIPPPPYPKPKTDAIFRQISTNYLTYSGNKPSIRQRNIQNRSVNYTNKSTQPSKTNNFGSAFQTTKLRNSIIAASAAKPIEIPKMTTKSTGSTASSPKPSTIIPSYNTNVGSVRGSSVGAIYPPNDTNVITGKDNDVNGFYNNVDGYQNNVNGMVNTVKGNANSISGDRNVVIGTGNTIMGKGNVVSSGTHVEGDDNVFYSRRK